MWSVDSSTRFAISFSEDTENVLNELKVHPQRETVYSGMAIWPASALEELTALSATRFDQPKDPRAMFMLLVSLSPDPSRTVSLIVSA